MKIKNKEAPKGYVTKNFKERIDEKTLLIIERFLDDKVAVNRSASTIYGYGCFLCKFFASEGKPFGEYTKDYMLNWKNKYRENRSRASLAYALSILSGIFKWGLSEGHIDILPLKKSWRPNLDRGHPKPLTRSDEAKLIVECETKCSLRDRALTKFLLDTGARRSEATSINAKDLNIENGTVLIIGKLKKWRTLRFKHDCGFLLKELLGDNYQGNTPVFRNNKGGRLSTRSVHRIIKRNGEIAGIGRNIYPHIMRHTFASRLVSNGAKLQSVCDLMGHARLSTTRIYADTELERKRQIYKRCMG